MAWKDRAKGNYLLEHSQMWKRLSIEVRRNIEIQFDQLRTWLDRKKRKPLEIMIEYRRIEYEEAWVSKEDGDLHIHFHNYSRRKPK